MNDDFDDGAHARGNDPETSHEAAASIAVSPLRKVILSALRKSGGATTLELVALTGVPHVTISPQLRPMARRKMVIDTGEKRVGETGRRSIVWKVAA